MGILSRIRVLDLSDELGVYVTKLLADLGAEVIRIDPPGTAPFHRAPYLGPDGVSLFHLFMNQNKKGITLDILAAPGEELLKRLWATSQVLVWSSLEGTRDRRWRVIDGLRGDPTKIARLITPFGLNGPYREHISSDLVTMAVGGLMSISGYPDCPVVPFGEQSFFTASLHATVGSMMALYHLKRTGRGQEVEVAAQEAIAHTLENAAQYVDLENIVRSRQGDVEPEAGRGIYLCQDGYVLLVTTLHGALLRWQELVAWLEEDGGDGAAALSEERWTNTKWRATPEAKSQFRTICERFASRYSKMDLYVEGQRRDVNICPLCSPRDIAESPQLRARHFFEQACSPLAGRDLTYVGAPYRTERVTSGHRSAVAAGADNAAVYGELGLSAADLESLRTRGVI